MRYLLSALLCSLLFATSASAWAVTDMKEGFSRTGAITPVAVCLPKEPGTSFCNNATASGVSSAALSKPTVYFLRSSSLADFNKSAGAGLEFKAPTGARIGGGVINVCVYIAPTHKVAEVVLKADDAVVRSWYSGDMGTGTDNGSCGAGKLYSVNVGAADSLKLMLTPLPTVEDGGCAYCSTCGEACYNAYPTAVYAYIDSMNLALSPTEKSVVLNKVSLSSTAHTNGFFGSAIASKRQACYQLSFSATGGGLFGYHLSSGTQTLVSADLRSKTDYIPGVVGNVNKKACFDTELLGEDGSYPITITVDDGNGGFIVNAPAIKVDLTPPSGGLRSQTGSQTPTLTFAFSDGKGSGVQTVKFTNNGQTISASDKTWKITSKGNVYTLGAKTKLLAGKRYRIAYTVSDYTRHATSGDVIFRVGEVVSAPRVDVIKVRKGAKPVVTMRVVSKLKLKSYSFTVNGKKVTTANKNWKLTRKGNQFVLSAKTPMKTGLYRIRWQVVNVKNQRAAGGYALRNITPQKRA